VPDNPGIYWGLFTKVIRWAVGDQLVLARAAESALVAELVLAAVVRYVSQKMVSPPAVQAPVKDLEQVVVWGPEDWEVVQETDMDRASLITPVLSHS
jgi:hypothetical protein